jgi:hypothetical protein
MASVRFEFEAGTSRVQVRTLTTSHTYTIKECVGLKICMAVYNYDLMVHGTV